jgi:hypothetical protein
MPCLEPTNLRFYLDLPAWQVCEDFQEYALILAFLFDKPADGER